MAWDDDSKQQAIEMYTAEEPTPENSMEIVKAIAEELEIKPSILKKAIRIAYKSKLTDTNADHEQLNDILETVGRTL